MLLLFAIAIVLITLYSICLYLFNHTIISADLLILFFFLLKSLLLLLSGDVEKNPGPKSHSNLKVCHYNLNSLASHNFAKVSSLKAYNAVHRYDIICISKTFLDTSISSNDPSLVLDGYTIIRADNPMDLKKGGVCIYFKETLPLNVLNITQLKECLVAEILYNNKKCFLVTLYRSPSQSDIEFDDFITNLELLIDNIYNLNPYFIILLGDLNAVETR